MPAARAQTYFVVSLLQSNGSVTSNSTGNNSTTIDLHNAITFGVVESYFTVINLLAFVGYLLLHKNQPLRSRYWVPLFVTFFFGIINVPVTIWHILTLVKLVPNYYNIAVFLNDVIYVTMVTAVCLQIFRLIIFQNLGIFQRQYTSNKAKHQQLQQENFYTTVQKRVKIYKFLLSPLFVFLILFPTFLIQLALSVTWILLSFVGKFNISNYRVFSVLIFVTIPIAACLVFVIYDLILNKFKIYQVQKFLLTKDRLLFRLDYLIGIIAFVFSVLSLGIPAFVSMNGTKRYIIMVFDLIRYTCITLSSGGGNCMVFIIATRIISSLRPQTSKMTIAKKSSRGSIKMDDEMDACLSSNEGIKAFKVFVKGEYSQENLECWLAIQEFKQLTTKEARGAHLKKMIYTFILPNSLLEVNIPQKIRLEVVDIYQRMHRLLYPGVPTPRLLDPGTKTSSLMNSKIINGMADKRKSVAPGSPQTPHSVLKMVVTPTSPTRTSEVLDSIFTAEEHTITNESSGADLLSSASTISPTTPFNPSAATLDTRRESVSITSIAIEVSSVTASLAGVTGIKNNITAPDAQFKSGSMILSNSMHKISKSPRGATPDTPTAAMEDVLFTNDLLLNLEVQICLNLQDSYSRFKKIWSYPQLIQAIKLVRQHESQLSTELQTK